MELETQYDIITAEAVNEISRHPHYDVDEYENFKIYSDDKYPERLINERRPSEQEHVKEYREKTYQPVFSEVFERVLNSLSRIYRSDGYFIKYPDNESEFPKISDTETLKKYLSKGFTKSNDLLNWTFQVCLKQYLIDANAFCIVWADAPSNPTEYRKPVPFILNSDKIIYAYEGHSIVWKDEHDDKKYYSLDKEAYCEWKRGRYNRIELVLQTFHPCGELPAFKLGGIVEEVEKLGREYQSRFKGMLPWLNTATVEFSDLQAEIVMHIHSEKWIYQDQQCPDCKGSGFMTRENQKVKCSNTKCKDGFISHSPYDVLRIRPAKTNMGETPAPTPPMGYIQKSTEIAKLQDERINNHRYRALAAVNMQFLELSPVAQSGVAKAYDRDETNNTFYGVACDLGVIMESISYYCALWRYIEIYPDKEQIKMMCPKVVVPNTFDILGSQFLVDELKQSKDSGVNMAVLSNIQNELIRKRFSDDPILINELTDASNLDPLAGLTEDEKALRLTNKGATRQDYIISAYIQDFIKMAYEENKEFNNLPRNEKYAVLVKFADAKIQEIDSRLQKQVQIVPGN